MSAHNALEELNKGALFIVCGGGDGANIFVNDGTPTSNDFNLVVVTGA